MVSRGVLVKSTYGNFDLYGIVITQGYETQTAIATHAVNTMDGSVLKGAELCGIIRADKRYIPSPRQFRVIEGEMRKLISTFELAKYLEEFSNCGRLFVFNKLSVKDTYSYTSKFRKEVIEYLLPNKVATKMAML